MSGQSLPEGLLAPVEAVEPDDGVQLPSQRPRRRGDCLPGGWNAARPCPFASCRYHLALDVSEAGSITINQPGREIEDLPATCALDVADAGPHTLEEISVHFGVVRERAVEPRGRQGRELDQGEPLVEGEADRHRTMVA